MSAYTVSHAMLHFALFSLTPQAKAAADEDEIVMEVAIPAELERDMLRNLCCVGTGGQEQPLFGCRRSRLRGVREFTLQFGTDDVAVYPHPAFRSRSRSVAVHDVMRP